MRQQWQHPLKTLRVGTKVTEAERYMPLPQYELEGDATELRKKRSGWISRIVFYPLPPIKKKEPPY